MHAKIYTKKSYKDSTSSNEKDEEGAESVGWICDRARGAYRPRGARRLGIRVVVEDFW